jgi:hypothetical protein
MPRIIAMKILKGRRRDAICNNENRDVKNIQTYDRRIGDYLIKNELMYNQHNREISIEDQILCALNDGWSLKGDLIPPVGDDVSFFQLIVKYTEPDSSNLDL